MFAAWLIASLLGVAGVAGLIVGSWSISTYRQLRRDGAPAPGRILRKLWLTPAMRVLRPGGTGHGTRLAGRRAWVWWNVRWGASGQSEAVVRSADEDVLHLTLVKPVEMYSSSSGRLLAATEVRFAPSAPPNYLWSTAGGVLEPLDSALGQLSESERPQARVCVL